MVGTWEKRRGKTDRIEMREALSAEIRHPAIRVLRNRDVFEWQVKTLRVSQSLKFFERRKISKIPMRSVDLSAETGTQTKRTRRYAV